jgi:hypothetical protein
MMTTLLVVVVIVSMVVIVWIDRGAREIGRGRARGRLFRRFINYLIDLTSIQPYSATGRAIVDFNTLAF